MFIVEHKSHSLPVRVRPCDRRSVLPACIDCRLQQAAVLRTTACGGDAGALDSMPMLQLSLVLLGYTSFAVATAVTKRQPNFVYVLCDDMNELLGDEAIVKQTRSLIADQGARAANA